MKKILALVAVLALSGCAVGPYGETYVDPVGAAVVGGAIGYGIGAYSRPSYNYYAPRPYYGGGYYRPAPSFGPRPGYGYGRPGYYGRPGWR